jgi:Ni/Co efflux regulator RcnB
METVMDVKKLILACAAAILLAAPAAAFADPEWGDHEHEGEGWEHHEHRDRDEDWRRHEWREHERWEQRGDYYGDEWAPRAYYAPRCYWHNEYYRNWWGQYDVRRVQICR